MGNSAARKDIHQQVTDSIIAALELGVRPWECPWSQDVAQTPVNLVSKKAYNGINRLVLWCGSHVDGYKSPYWLTFKQAKELGGNVKKGESSTHIVFFKNYEKTSEESGEIVKIPVMRGYSVFNVEQCEGIETPTVVEPTFHPEFSPIERAEHLIECSGAKITESGDRAFFRPATDEIYLPSRTRFATAEDFYCTAAHELAHWSFAKRRLDVDMSVAGDTQKQQYAYEELCAESASAQLCAELGLKGQLQHESYIAHWLTALRNDKKLVFKAAAAASKASVFLMEKVEAVDQRRAEQAAQQAVQMVG